MRSIVLLALMCAILQAQEAKPHQALPTRAELDSISSRGTELAAYDQAAWEASDALRIIDPAPGSAQYYVAAGHGKDWSVYYGNLSSAKDTFYIVYSAGKSYGDSVYKASRMPYINANTGDQLHAARAIATALDWFGKSARRPYNYAAIHASSSSGEWWVYLYPSQLSVRTWPLGADVRFRVSQDGGRILEVHRMHASILESPVGDSIVINGARLEAYYHSAVVDNRPEDSDVFAVLARKPRRPEFVSVDGGYTYEIKTDGTISLPVKQPPPKPPTAKTGR